MLRQRSANRRNARGALPVLLLALGLAGAAAQTVYSTKFEDPNSGFIVYIGDGIADYNLQSESAKMNGAFGARLTVRTPAAQQESIVLSSPLVDMTQGSTYTFDFHARTKGAPAVVKMVVQSGMGIWYAQADQRINGEAWQHFQVPFTAPETKGYRLSFAMGTNATELQLDDFKVIKGVPSDEAEVSTPVPPAPVPTPTIATTPSNSFTGVPSIPPTSNNNNNINTGSNTGSSSSNGGSVSGGGSSKEAQGELVSTGLEGGDTGGFTAFVFQGADAEIDMASSKAARTGKAGIEVTNNAVQQENWHVQLKSPIIEMDPTKVYTLKYWAKSNTPGMTATVDLLLDGAFTWVTGEQILPGKEWKQYTIDSVQVPNPGRYFYGFAMGDNEGSIYLDDFEIIEAEGGGKLMMSYDFASTASSSGMSPSITQFQEDIEKHRTGNLTVTFKDSVGAPVGSLDSLKLKLQQHDFAWGVAVNHQKAPSPEYWDVAAENFNAMVNENILKWADYEPTQGDYEDNAKIWDEQYLKWAEKNNMTMIRGHALEWLHDGYGFDKHWSRQDGCDKYREYLEDRIKRDVAAFKGRVHEYDVWNELLHQRNFALKCGLLTDGTIANALQWAAEADPEARMCMNDFNLIDGQATDEMYDMIKELQAQKAPVHCIGIQAHLDVAKGVAFGPMKSKLDKLAELGLPMVISEFDIRTGDIPPGPTGPYTGTPDLDLEPEVQADIMAALTASWFAHPAVKGIFLWGFTDAAHWINNAGIFDKDLQPKPAADKLKQLWTETWSTSVDKSKPSLSQGAFGFKGYFGTYTYEATMGGKKYTGTVKLTQDSPKADVTLAGSPAVSAAIAG